jgi:integrase
MSQSTNSAKTSKKAKPKKPHKDFPLFPHATGRWAKKIRGKFHYFGKWDDPQAALSLWLEQKDDLLAGRRPRNKSDGLTVADLCNRFLTSKKRLLENEEIGSRTFRLYLTACKRIVDAFSRTWVVEDLQAEDFERFRSELTKGRGPVALGNEIRYVRMVFKYAADAGLIDRPVRIGPDFKMPSKRILRQNRIASGPRMLEADQIRATLAATDQTLRAMILLGVNCGLGNTDLSCLTLSALDLGNGWLDYPRPKTGVQRRCPLWPETVDALRTSIAASPTAKDDADSGLVFITKYGRRWVKTSDTGSPDDAIGKEFSKLLTRLGMKRPGLNFYALRHTFETIAGESKDQVAVNAIMGHVDTSMAATYRERISDERLQDVVGVVRAWLWPDGV